MVLYESLTGRPPFEATSPHEYVLLHSRDQQFKPLDLPADLPGGAELQAVIAKGLERDRNKRFANAREFAAALEQVERSLPDPKAIRTVNIETPVLDLDATFNQQTPLPSSTTKADTLHRSTVRTGFGHESETIRTPLPGAGAPTRAFPPMAASPAQQTVIETRTRSSSAGPFIVIGVIILLAAGAIAAVLMLRKTNAEKPPAQMATVTNPPVAVQTASPPQATVDVVSITPVTTSSAPVTTSSAQPTLSTTTTRPAIVLPPPVTHTTTRPPVVQEPAKQPEPKPREPEPQTPRPAPAASVKPFIDGDTGDADVNEELVSYLSNKLIGVTSIAVRGPANDQQKVLLERLRKNNITVVESAPTVVDFDGTLEQVGRGKKRRSARATVTKDGRVIFRYELPPEEYRVGDSPAEAFARILAEAFGH